MPELLAQAKKSGFLPIIVNDGSGPESSGLFREASEYGTVLIHPTNLGKGRAIKTGLSYIRSHYPLERCTVVTMDADGQHRVSDAERLCRVSEAHPSALVLGSRRLNRRVPFRSLLGNTVTRLVYHISTGQKVYDTQTGLRAFQGTRIPWLLSVPGERYEYEMNVLLMSSRERIPLVEEEIDTIYLHGNTSSHFDTVKDSCRVYKEILKYSAASLSCFLLDYGLYALLTQITSGMGSIQSVLVSNVGARIVSGCANYSMNRLLVFRSNAALGRSALQYALLACAVLAGNTAVLGFLTNQTGLNRYTAKLITEFVFFFISWLIQKKVIFSRKKETPEHHAAQRAKE